MSPEFCPGLLEWWLFLIKILANKTNFHNFLDKIVAFSAQWWMCLSRIGESMMTGGFDKPECWVHFYLDFNLVY
jgi:hypothetical protein